MANGYIRRGAGLVLSCAFWAAGSCGGAWAEMQLPRVADPLVQKECGACHMLYVPALLPSRSWSLLVGGLGDHFGENADLPADMKKALAGYFAANAADAAGRNGEILENLSPSSAPLRISELPWWKRKHERKDRVSPAALKLNGAKFKSDCAACHKEAVRGFFDKPEKQRGRSRG